jgi:8-amino-7-oxononanoate synthase
VPFRLRLSTPNCQPSYYMRLTILFLLCYRFLRMDGKLSFIEEGLDSLKQKGLYRRIRWVEQGPAPWVKVDGRRVLLLCSNNYLGLANDSRLKRAAARAVEEWGCGSGGSRAISGSLGPHRELEERLARFHGREAALLFNSGYSANLSIVPALMGEGDVVFSDELNHASIVDACRLSRATVQVYPHRDTERLDSLITETRGRRRLIVTDGLFSMDGDLAPLADIVDLAKKHGCLVMVDDAHAIGVIGPNGLGSPDHFRLSEGIDIHVGTFGKAVGSFGAYVVGKRSLVEYLLNRGRVFLYTTALPPSVPASVIAAIDILEQEPERRRRLLENADYLRTELNGLGFDTMQSETHIIPLLTRGEEITMEMDKALLQEGVFVQGIRPPTVPRGMCRLRVTVMATHTREDLDFALDKFRKVGRRLALIH